MRTAVIDIGTNTALLLIAEFDHIANNIVTLLDKISIPRLGAGVDSSGIISKDSFAKAVSVIEEYKITAKEFDVTNIIAVGTSFLRDSQNSESFIKAIHNKTGVQIEILSGEDEAKWTFWGGIYDFINNETKDNVLCIIDIGGGSTEVSYSRCISGRFNKELLYNCKINTKSLDIGSVRLLERFFKVQPAENIKISLAEKWILNALEKIDLPGDRLFLAGVAGTVTSLACIKLGLKDYDAKKTEGTVITLREIEEILHKLRDMSIEKISAIGGFMKGRSDIIVPGILILKTFMSKFSINKINTSTYGLRYGILLRESFK